ncbi:CZB domain-containing protein [uncultured Hymenobacter sp.]|uniref:CZB domain-containing protein n=1 Tax=uncultured Hymenobacter sp. TaxID=170016 RepID=UPI0035C9AD79
MTDELKQDFESGMVKHLLFKSKLRSYLYGSKINPGPIRDPAQCAFGAWIQERALGAYAHLSESRELDHLHTLIHREASRLMDMHERGETEQALAGLSAVEKMANQLTLLLRTMEQKLRTGF